MIVGIQAYGTIALIWLGAAIAWAIVASKLGHRFQTPNDGCLLGCGNVVLTFVGGGAGFLAAPYPWAIGTSLVGTILLPGLVTLFFVSKSRKP